MTLTKYQVMVLKLLRAILFYFMYQERQQTGKYDEGNLKLYDETGTFIEDCQEIQSEGN